MDGTRTKATLRRNIFTVLEDSADPLISLISFGLCALALLVASFLGAALRSFIFASPSLKAPALCNALAANLFGAGVRGLCCGGDA